MPLGVDNLIEKSWAVFEKFQRANGQTVDEPSFVGGFMSCYGIIVGTVDVGLTEEQMHEPGIVLALLERMQRDIEDIRTKVISTQHDVMKKGH